MRRKLICFRFFDFIKPHVTSFELFRLEILADLVSCAWEWNGFLLSSCQTFSLKVSANRKCTTWFMQWMVRCVTGYDVGGFFYHT